MVVSLFQTASGRNVWAAEDVDVFLPSSLQVWTEERAPSELLLQVNSSLSPARSVNLRESCKVLTRENSTVVISD